jgi:hypothetical protein
MLESELWFLKALSGAQKLKIESVRASLAWGGVPNYIAVRRGSQGARGMQFEFASVIGITRGNTRRELPALCLR